MDSPTGDGGSDKPTLIAKVTETRVTKSFNPYSLMLLFYQISDFGLSRSLLLADSLGKLTTTYHRNKYVVINAHRFFSRGNKPRASGVVGA